MGKFGEVTVGRIGRFKSDTICLPSISNTASDHKQEIRGEGGGVTKLAQCHIPARHKRTC